MTNGTLFSGKTVEDAIADALRTLGLTQDQVVVDVLSRGSRGLFGIGSEPAQVRVTPKPQTAAPPLPAVASAPGTDVPMTAVPAQPDTAAGPADTPEQPQPAPVKSEIPPMAVAAAGAPEEPLRVTETILPPLADEDATVAALAAELLAESVRLMGFEATVIANWRGPDADNDEPYLHLNLHGSELGALIGRRGETLNNIQYLLRLMVNQRFHQWKNIVVDVEEYRQHRVDHLTQLALRSAEQVTRTGKPLSLEPMAPNERRIIHLALRAHPSVYTESSGDGERRKVQILPKRD